MVCGLEGVCKTVHYCVLLHSIPCKWTLLTRRIKLKVADNLPVSGGMGSQRLTRCQAYVLLKSPLFTAAWHWQGLTCSFVFIRLFMDKSDVEAPVDGGVAYPGMYPGQEERNGEVNEPFDTPSQEAPKGKSATNPFAAASPMAAAGCMGMAISSSLCWGHTWR